MRLLKKCLECKHWMLTWSWVIYSLDFALDGTVLLCCVSILTPVLLRLINWGLKANICIHHLFKVFGAVTHLFYSFEEFHLVMVQQKLWNIYLWWTQHSKHLHKAMLRILLCDVYNVVSVNFYGSLWGCILPCCCTAFVFKIYKKHREVKMKVWVITNQQTATVSSFIHKEIM